MTSIPPNTATTQPNQIRHVEVAIIGAGTAGQNAYKQAVKHSDRIAIINDGYWTTTCATVGCMPSKLLLASAERAYHAKHSQEFGVTADVVIDGTAVMQRVQAERDRFAGFVQDQVDGFDEAHKISGRASIDDDGAIVVNGERIFADKIIIATGTTPQMPEGWAEALGDRLLTSDNVFELTDLPRSMAVVGTGAIGLELAQAFHRLGVQVRVFNRIRNVAGLKDAAVREQAIDCLSRELDFAFDSDIYEVGTTGTASDRQAYLAYRDADGVQQQFLAEYVLVATGRRSTLKELGVEHLGVDLDDKHFPKHWHQDTGQVADLPVYVAGDANGRLPLLHVASDEGYRAGQDWTTQTLDSANIRKPTPAMTVVFTEPQIAYVGMSLDELEATGDVFVTGKVNFDTQGRSRVMGVNCGLLHLYACKHTDKLLGACLVAPDAEYMAHILANALSHGQTIAQLLDAPFYHPTILEGLRTALRDAQSQMDIPHQEAGRNEF